MSLFKARFFKPAAQRTPCMPDAERKQYTDEVIAAHRAEDARKRLIGYRTASKPESVELVKFTAMRGMSRKRMDEIWGPVFVNAVLGSNS